ncbi:MAG: DnaJ central domain protein [Planctomycetaceae bacterium]|nr:DnaJ central domain protein [Planctomycetaceae bacterium]
MGLFGFIFGDGNKERAQRDQWSPSVVGKNLISPVNSYGTCFSCEGTGSRRLKCGACEGTGAHPSQCRQCRGSGLFERPAQPCFRCSGTGSSWNKPCSKCNGSGIFKPALSQPCRTCAASGKISHPCRRCEGGGDFVVECKKCDGSGWFKFKN